MSKLNIPTQTYNKEQEKVRLLNVAFYMGANLFGQRGGIVNLTASQYEHLDRFAEEWNDKQPGRKGCFHAGPLHTVRQILYLAAQQMEEMRLAKPSQYLMYLSNNCDTFPVYTSRTSLAKICDGNPDPKTIYNHLKLAQRAKAHGFSIVTRTSRSSSQREVYKNEKGEVTIIHKMTARGHGDLIVYVSKKAFLFNYDVNFLNTDNQLVTATKRKNLPPLSYTKLETIVSNSITSEYGALHPSNQTPVGDHFEKGHPVKRDTPEGTPISSLGRVASAVSRLAEVFKSHDRKAGSPAARAEKAYWRHIDALNAISKRAKSIINPKGNARHACIVILMILYRRLLFPRISDHYWTSIEERVQARLALHLDRVMDGATLADKSQEIKLFEAFRLVRRGIVKVHDNMGKHRDRYAEGSLRVNAVKYLDLDADDDAFSFKKVMDVWVMSEMRRTLQRSHQENNLFRWQMCFREKEKLVKEAYKCLVNEDYHAFMAEAKISYRRINDVCDKVDCPMAVRRKIINSFIAEINAIKDFLTDREFHQGIEWVNEFVKRFSNEFQKAA